MEVRALLEGAGGGVEKLATPGLGRSERPLGRGREGASKLRTGLERSRFGNTGEGAGLERSVGRLKVRGDGRLGVLGGAEKSDEPRKLEGWVTCAAYRLLSEWMRGD